MTIAFTAQSGSHFWSRHVLPNGSKLQNTNCTETFYWLQQRDININQITFKQIITNYSERFFKFIPLVSVSFHQYCPGFDGMRSINNASGKVLSEQRIFPLIND